LGILEADLMADFGRDAVGEVRSCTTGVGADASAFGVIILLDCSDKISWTSKESEIPEPRNLDW
jgi:hypothetical protein